MNKIKDALISGVDGGEYYDETLTIKLINLVQNGSFEDMSNWTTWLTSSTDSSQQKYGKHSLKLGGDTLNGDALASTAIEKPIAGHKYYGREYLKTNGELTAADCRFEIISTDIVPEEAHIFGWNQGNYPDWTMISDVITIPYANADSYIVRTFTVGGSVEAWVDGLMVIDLTATFGEGNEPSKEWCDTNIPFFEGGKKAYIDFNNSIRFISDLHKITILGEKFNLRANVTIEGIKYNDENKEIYVPDRTIIKCEVSGAYSIGANDSGTGLIIINGQEIVSAYGCSKTYDYIVKDDLTIRLDENGGLSSSSYGMITIDEKNVGHIHFYDDWVFDNETYHSKTCVCGDVISEKHDWDEGVVTVEPTTTSTGIMTYTCSVCGCIKTEEIPVFIEAPVLAASNTWYKGTTDRSTITQIDIVPSYNGDEYTESWDASEAQDGSIMCYIDGTNLTIAGNGFDTIKLNPDSSYLFSFRGANTSLFESLTAINGLSNFDTSNVTNMNGMFSRCYALSSFDLSNFDTSNVTNMANMFSHCESLELLDLSSFDTVDVIDMNGMFAYCYKLSNLGLSSFDTSNVTNMANMFYSCESLVIIYGSEDFTTHSLTSSTNMFLDCIVITGGNGTVYDSNYIDATYARIDTADTPGYFTEHDNHSWKLISSEKTESGAVRQKYVCPVCGEKYTQIAIY